MCGFWIRMFPFQKVIELGDTVLLVLQKRKLLTYFWTHHLGALLITWYLYPQQPSIAVWLTLVINVFHVPVYLYGTIRSFEIKPPKQFTAAMILLEIVHMLVHMVLSSFMLYYMLSGRECFTALHNLVLLLSMYSLCLILSAILFHNRFLLKKNPSTTVSSATLATIVTN